jgi:hypothetical protein
MVHLGTDSPYSSFAHPTKDDYSGRGNGYCDVPGIYAKRWRDINKIGASEFLACKSNNVVAIYGK